MRNVSVFILGVMLGLGERLSADDALVAEWKLETNTRNSISGGPDAVNQGVKFTGGKPQTEFDGRGSHLTIPHEKSLQLGTADFAVLVRVNTAERLDDDLGDLISNFDPATRTGFHLSLRNNAGVTHSQANYRQLQWGIDAGSEPVFTDEGRPGKSIYGQTMAVHAGQLYVGTCESGSTEAGHVYRYAGPAQWIDCGSPDKANSITGMAAFQNELYVGSGKYRLGGSSLKESENPHLGGRIFRYLGEQRWEEVGHFPEMEAVGGMVVYQGKLYLSSLYKPAAFYRYDGEKRWTKLDVPNGKRVEALGVYNGYLWASGYDEGNVYRFDGTHWTDLGRVGEAENTQTYAFSTYRNQLQVATWRTGKVFAWENEAWVDRGRLGQELEVMGMLVHNGCLYGGTLPLGQLYRYDGGQNWTLLKQLDTTPDVTYRRVWTMAEFQGKLFATTLPSGHVWSMSTGTSVSWDQEFPPGEHHITAQRKQNTLQLFVDGKLVAESPAKTARAWNLDNQQPWLIGAGPGDSFHGSIFRVQVYRRALSTDEIEKLARE